MAHSKSSRANRHSTLVRAGVSIGFGAMLLVGMGVGMGPGFEREGGAARADLLSAMETQPIEADFFDSLDGWTLGQALDAQTIEGKVVLIGFVSGVDPQSIMAFSGLSRYERNHGKDGLVVLAVHPELGWDAVNQQVLAEKIKVQVARDVGDALADRLSVDDQPDYYVIDRAGQLRYADLKRGSLKPALKLLISETPEDAIANAQKEAQGIAVVAQGDEQAKKNAIPPAKYKKADWPAHNGGKLYAKNFQGQELPVALGREKWLTKKKDLEGKVIVLDFWATWCGPCRKASPLFDSLQKKYEGKVEVLAISGQRENERTVRKYINNKKVSYSHLYDGKQRIYKKLGISGIPHALIISSDGIIRWQGFPSQGSIDKALEQIVKVDPVFEE